MKAVQCTKNVVVGVDGNLRAATHRNMDAVEYEQILKQSKSCAVERGKP